MRKIYFLLMLATAVLFATQTATVTGLDPNGDGFLSLRKKPKQREIGKLYNGDKVEILSQSGKYYKVKDVKSGMIGYAHSNWIRKTSNSTTASTSTSQKQGTVHGLDPNGDGFLAVRSKPKGRKLGELYNGDTVAILGQRGSWYKVRTSSGLVGWSHGDWIEEKNVNSDTHIDPTTVYTGIEFQTKMLQKDNVENSVIKKYFSILDEQFEVKSNAFTPDNTIVIKAPKTSSGSSISLTVNYPLLEKGEKLFLFMPKERSPRIISFIALQSQPLNISFKTYINCDAMDVNIVAILLHKNGKININSISVLRMIGGGEGKYCIRAKYNKKMETRFSHKILDDKTIIKSKIKDNKIKFGIDGLRKRSKDYFNIVKIDSGGTKLMKIVLSENSKVSLFSMKLPNEANQVILKFEYTNGKSILKEIKNVKDMSEEELENYRNKEASKRKKLDAFRIKEKYEEEKEEAIALVSENGLKLKELKESFRKDREVVLAAVKQKGTALEYVDDSLKKDKEIVLAAVKENGYALEYADDSLQKDKEVVLAAVKENGYALEYADDSLKKDKEVVLATVKQSGYALRYGDASLKKDKEVVLAALKQDGGALRYADASLKKDKEVVLAVVKEKGGALEYADDSLKKDREVVLTAVKEDGSALEYADDSLRINKKIVMASGKSEQESVKYIKEEKHIYKMLPTKAKEIKKLYSATDIDSTGEYTLKDIFGNTIHVNNTKNGLEFKEFKNKIIILNIASIGVLKHFRMTDSLISLQKKYAQKIVIINILTDCSSDSLLNRRIIMKDINYIVIKEENAVSFLKNLKTKVEIPGEPFIIAFDKNSNAQYAKAGALSLTSLEELVSKMLSL